MPTRGADQDSRHRSVAARGSLRRGLIAGGSAFWYPVVWRCWRARRRSRALRNDVCVPLQPLCLCVKVFGLRHARGPAPFTPVQDVQWQYQAHLDLPKWAVDQGACPLQCAAATCVPQPKTARLSQPVGNMRWRQVASRSLLSIRYSPLPRNSTPARARRAAGESATGPREQPSGRPGVSAHSAASSRARRPRR